MAANDDFLDEIISERSKVNPRFPRLVREAQARRKEEGRARSTQAHGELSEPVRAWIAASQQEEQRRQERHDKRLQAAVVLLATLTMAAAITLAILTAVPQ